MIATILICSSLVAYDGDSVHCQPSGQMLRLLGSGTPYESGIDAPEIGKRTRCDKEEKLAEKAKARLQTMISGGVTVEAYNNDRFGRPLVNLYDQDGNEIGAEMLKEGFVRPWRPHHKNDWCK